MAYRFLAIVAIQGILLQTVYCQCVNRVMPSCGPNVLETILPGPCSGPLLPAPIYQSPVISGPVISELGYPAPTIIQDSSVANSLANALQLLVVSNLLSTTLPGPCDMPIYPYEVMPPYNYVY